VYADHILQDFHHIGSHDIQSRNNSKIIKDILKESKEEKYDWIGDMKNYFTNIYFFTQKLQTENKSEIFDNLTSVIHMHINRLFRTKQRFDECVIYYLLSKHYHSMINFSKYNI
jgi:hypothetical protein